MILQNLQNTGSRHDITLLQRSTTYPLGIWSVCLVLTPCWPWSRPERVQHPTLRKTPAMGNISFLNVWNDCNCLPSTIATNVGTRSTQTGTGGYDTEQILYEDSNRAWTKAPEITFTTRLRVIFFLSNGGQPMEQLTKGSSESRVTGLDQK